MELSTREELELNDIGIQIWYITAQHFAIAVLSYQMISAFILVAICQISCPYLTVASVAVATGKLTLGPNVARQAHAAHWVQ